MLAEFKKIRTLFDPVRRLPNEDDCRKIVRDQFSDPEEVALYRQDVREGLNESESRLVERFMRPPTRVLDVGCGAGREAFALVRKGFEVVGIDISAAMIESATLLLPLDGTWSSVVSPGKRRGWGRVVFEQVDALEYQSSPASFDAIYFSVGSPSYGLIPSRKRRIALLNHFRMLLKSDGVLMFSVLYDAMAFRWNKANFARLVRSGMGWLTGEGFFGERGDSCFLYGLRGAGRGYYHVFSSPNDVLKEVSAGGFESIYRDDGRGVWVCRIKEAFSGQHSAISN